MLTQHLLIEIHQTQYSFSWSSYLLPFPTKEDLILTIRRRKEKMRADITQSKNLDLWSSTSKIFFFFFKHQACELKLPPGSYNFYSKHLAGNPSTLWYGEQGDRLRRKPDPLPDKPGVSKKHTRFAAIIGCFLLNGPLRIKRTRKYSRRKGGSQPECKQEPIKSKRQWSKGGWPETVIPIMVAKLQANQ